MSSTKSENRIPRNRILFPLLLALLGAASASNAAETSEGDGLDVRAWTDLQKSGTAASPVSRPLPGEIADRSYKRYADSFSQPIPEHLGREGFVSDSGGGGSGGGK